MKKIYSLSILFLSCSFLLKAQAPSINTTTLTCINQTVQAAITTTYFGNVNYQWTIVPATPTLSLGQPAGVTIIAYTGCGVHTITCTGYDQSNNIIPSATASQTVSVSCNIPQQPSSLQTATSVCQGFSTTVGVIPVSGAIYIWYPSLNFQPTMLVGPGTYTLLTSLPPEGCTVASIFTVALAPPITLVTSQSTQTCCIISNALQTRNPVTLFAAGASTYSWMPYIAAQMTFPIGPTTTVRPLASTCYTVTGTTAVCTGTAQLCVTVTPQPTLGAGPDNVTICKGAAQNLSVTTLNGSTAPGGLTYSWNESTPGTLNNYTTQLVAASPTIATTYTVESFNALGCVSLPKVLKLFVDPCTGISELSSSNRFSMYPNPAENQINIESENSGDVSVTVFNAMGQIALSQTFTSGAKKQIDVSDLNPGIYFVEISSEGVFENHRLMKH